jgi:5-methylcytosine-specific restriction endonuclease McrA
MQRATSEEIINAYKETGSVWKAAAKLGICGQSVHERLVRLGYPMLARHWEDDERQAARHLVIQGFPISKIAEILGRSYAGVACELSAMKIQIPTKRTLKPPRGIGLTKRRVLQIGRKMIAVDELVTRVARRERIRTTSLVKALQVLAPTEWQIYVLRHGGEAQICPGCGNEFRPLNARQKCCTTLCSRYALSDRKYFGGNRRSAIGLNEGVCQLCEKKGKTLSVHHMFGKKNDPENEFLIALCSGCHHIVSILGGRTDCLETGFWENLISLTAARKMADSGIKPEALEVCVSLEQTKFEEYLN